MKGEVSKEYTNYSYILKEACVSGLNNTRNSNVM